MGRASACCDHVPVGALRGPTGAARGGVVKLEDRDGPADGMGHQGITDEGTVDPAGLRAMTRRAQAGRVHRLVLRLVLPWLGMRAMGMGGRARRGMCSCFILYWVWLGRR